MLNKKYAFNSEQHLTTSFYGSSSKLLQSSNDVWYSAPTPESLRLHSEVHNVALITSGLNLGASIPQQVNCFYPVSALVPCMVCRSQRECPTYTANQRRQLTSWGRLSIKSLRQVMSQECSLHSNTLHLQPSKSEASQLPVWGLSV